MRKGAWVPDRGEAIWLQFDPQAGREQRGRRPALVLSPAAYNAKAGLAFVCPITSRVKGYPFEVALPEGEAIAGVVLADHARSVDWQERRAELIGRLPEPTVQEVTAKLVALISVD